MLQVSSGEDAVVLFLKEGFAMRDFILSTLSGVAAAHDPCREDPWICFSSKMEKGPEAKL